MIDPQLAGVDTGDELTLDLAGEAHGASPLVDGFGDVRLDDVVEVGGHLHPTVSQGVEGLGLVFAGEGEVLGLHRSLRN
ncbi:MAG: hypothetical protein CL959_01925 [Euryarchaeota archaeon]|nr:hypothetical protein [Euryarchaeota archaeon]